MRPKAYRRTPSEQNSKVTGTRHCHTASASETIATTPNSHPPPSHQTTAPSDRIPDGNNHDQVRSFTSGQLRQRTVDDEDDDSASAWLIKLRMVDSISNSFDHRPLSMPVTNHAIIQYNIELNRIAPNISTVK